MAVVKAQQERKLWGWGYEGEGLSDAEVEQLGNEMQARFGVQPRKTIGPPSLASLTIPEPRLRPPASLASLSTQDRRERAVHTLGKSYDDLVRGIRGNYRNAPDVVAYPTDEREVAEIIGWCAEIKAAAIPFGG